MQFVEDKYYIWYNQVITILGAIVAILALVSWIIPSLAILREHWGLVPIVGIFGIIQVIYATMFFKKQERTWSGGFLAAMIYTIIIVGVVHNSGYMHSWLMVLWFLQVLVSGMFGLYATVACSFMIVLYYILEATDKIHQQAFDPIGIGIVFGTFILSVISYAFWKHLYLDVESSQVNQLTGQLKSKQLQTEILIESIGDGIIVTDTEGKISLLNPAAATMLKWSIDEAVGIDISLVAKLKEEDGSETPDTSYPFSQVIRTGKQIRKIARIVSRNGQDHQIVSLIISPVVLPKSNELIGTIAVLRDISAEREEEHRRADFISTASHEMRTPVAAIEGYLALALNDKVSRIDSKARAFLIKAHESTQRLGQLFQDLLTSAKAEDGRLVNHPIIVEIGEYLTQITDGLRFAAQKKGLLMDFTIGTHEHVSSSVAGGKIIKPLYYAMIDPDRMREVITNLFDNAVKYTEAGKISIGLTGNDDVIQIFIRDTGHGIPAEDLPHLFQKFYRVDNSSTRTIGGTGLGLFICRKIIEMYHGRIWVESELTKGSTFYINLPRTSSNKAIEAQSKQSTELKL